MTGMQVREGQRWRTTRAMAVDGLTMWRAPFTGGFHGEVPAGAVLTVRFDPVPSGSAVSCLPEDYEALEVELVPVEDREAEKYDGYVLVIDLAAFGTDLLPA